jgi:hypothetical protein
MSYIPCVAGRSHAGEGGESHDDGGGELHLEDWVGLSWFDLEVVIDVIVGVVVVRFGVEFLLSFIPHTGPIVVL